MKTFTGLLVGVGLICLVSISEARQTTSTPSSPEIEKLWAEIKTEEAKLGYLTYVCTYTTGNPNALVSLPECTPSDPVCLSLYKLGLELREMQKRSILSCPDRIKAMTEILLKKRLAVADLEKKHTSETRVILSRSGGLISPMHEDSKKTEVTKPEATKPEDPNLTLYKAKMFETEKYRLLSTGGGLTPAQRKNFDDLRWQANAEMLEARKHLSDNVIADADKVRTDEKWAERNGLSPSSLTEKDINTRYTAAIIEEQKARQAVVDINQMSDREYNQYARTLGYADSKGNPLPKREVLADLNKKQAKAQEQAGLLKNTKLYENGKASDFDDLQKEAIAKATALPSYMNQLNAQRAKKDTALQAFRDKKRNELLSTLDPKQKDKAANAYAALQKNNEIQLQIEDKIKLREKASSESEKESLTNEIQALASKRDKEFEKNYREVAQQLPDNIREKIYDTFKSDTGSAAEYEKQELAQLEDPAKKPDSSKKEDEPTIEDVLTEKKKEHEKAVSAVRDDKKAEIETVQAALNIELQRLQGLVNSVNQLENSIPQNTAFERLNPFSRNDEKRERLTADIQKTNLLIEKSGKRVTVYLVKLKQLGQETKSLDEYLDEFQTRNFAVMTKLEEEKSSTEDVADRSPAEQAPTAADDLDDLATSETERDPAEEEPKSSKTAAPTFF